MNPFYQEYMASDAWKAKRLQRLDLDGHKCRTCGHDGSTFSLQVHHVTYEHFTNERLDDLITLCASCHEAITDAMRRRRYDGRHYEVQAVTATITARQEIQNYGMANTAVQVEFVCSPAHAQRADGKPTEQVGEVDETDFIQARQDRRRL